MLTMPWLMVWWAGRCSAVGLLLAVEIDTALMDHVEDVGGSKGKFCTIRLFPSDGRCSYGDDADPVDGLRPEEDSLICRSRGHVAMRHISVPFLCMC